MQERGATHQVKMLADRFPKTGRQSLDRLFDSGRSCHSRRSVLRTNQLLVLVNRRFVGAGGGLGGGGALPLVVRANAPISHGVVRGVPDMSILNVAERSAPTRSAALPVFKRKSAWLAFMKDGFVNRLWSIVLGPGLLSTMVLLAFP